MLGFQLPIGTTHLSQNCDTYFLTEWKIKLIHVWSRPALKKPTNDRLLWIGLIKLVHFIWIDSRRTSRGNTDACMVYRLQRQGCFVNSPDLEANLWPCIGKPCIWNHRMRLAYTFLLTSPNKPETHFYRIFIFAFSCKLRLLPPPGAIVSLQKQSKLKHCFWKYTGSCGAIRAAVVELWLQ